MTYVYLVYGMAFVSLGLAVAIYPKQKDAMRISRYLPLLAAFGILHGLNEWVDLARRLEGDLHGLMVARSLLLSSSMFLLAMFGARAFGAGSTRESWWRALPWALLAVFAIVVVASHADPDAVDSASRYLFGIAGSVLAALAFARERPQVARYGAGAVHLSLWPAVVGFVGYAVVAGVIGRPASMFPANVINSESFFEWFGVPVQVLRTLAACLVTYGVVGLLSVFRWHQEHRIAASEERYRGLVQLAPLGILIVEDGHISFANRRAAEIVGVAGVSGLLDRSVVELVSADDREHLARMVGELTLGERGQYADDEVTMCRDEQGVKVLLAAAPLHVGTERGIQIVFQDITRLKQQEAELARHRDRLDELVRERTAELEQAMAELKQAMSEVKTLSGMLPVCAWCRRIRDDDGYWEQLESYVSSRSDAQFTHGICPDCSHKIKRGAKPKGD